MEKIVIFDLDGTLAIIDRRMQLATGGKSTESDYKKINWEKVSKIMRNPSWLFDTRSILNPTDIDKSDLNFWQIGDCLL